MGPNLIQSSKASATNKQKKINSLIYLEGWILGGVSPLRPPLNPLVVMVYCHHCHWTGMVYLFGSLHDPLWSLQVATAMTMVAGIVPVSQLRGNVTTWTWSTNAGSHVVSAAQVGR